MHALLEVTAVLLHSLLLWYDTASSSARHIPFFRPEGGCHVQAFSGLKNNNTRFALEEAVGTTAIVHLVLPL